MKVKAYLFSFVLFLFFTATVYAGNANLAQNAGFEEGTSQKISSWTSHAWGDKPDIAEFKLDENEKHSGQKSALIVNKTATDARFRQEIKVKANTYYKLSCWIKAENVGAEAKGANISVDGITDTSKDVRGNNWEYVELYGKTDKGQKEIIVTLGLGGYGSLNTGKAWFDDLVVEELSKVPEGKSAVNFFVSATPAQPAANKGSIAAIAALFLILLAGLMAGLAFANAKTSSRNQRRPGNAQKDIAPEESTFGLKLDRKDLAIMAAMTLLYLLIALFNLGSLKVPQTSWQPAKADEGFVLDFGREIDVAKLYYYSGLGDGKFRVEYTDKTGKFVPLITEEKKAIFSWKSIATSTKTDKLKFIFEVPGSTLNEIAIVENGKQEPVKDFKITDIQSDSGDAGSVNLLFDEQNTFTYTPSYMTDMYFDEIYHARTAFEHIHKLQPFEWTHPPLGKIIIAIGISLFGMNPFGWRIMGTLVGAAMIPLMYLFGRKLFHKKFYAFCTAFLIMFDFMHFTQTRIATIDVYGTFFIILMYYYMYDYYVNKSYTLGFRKSLRPLFLSGLFFGIGVASKWIAVYGGAGLAVLFFTAKILEYRDYRRITADNKANKPEWLKHFVPLYQIGTMLYCVLFFVVIPGVIYYLSYIPYMLVPGAKPGLQLVLDNQEQMYSYHSKLQATHSFSSPWFEWPVIFKPTWFYSGSNLPPDKASTIVTMGNPAIWWFGIFAIAMALVITIYKKDKKMTIVFVAMAFQYLPWVLVSRITWIYHFFSTVPFMILAIVYVIKNFMESYKDAKYWVYGYLCLAAVLFIWFYPALSGLEVNKGYIDSLKWFKSWIF